jgi:hypothetical protein
MKSSVVTVGDIYITPTVILDLERKQIVFPPLGRNFDVLAAVRKYRAASPQLELFTP